MRAFNLSAFLAVAVAVASAAAPAASGATFSPIVPASGPEMALRIDGQINEGDAGRFVDALEAAGIRYSDHRMRAIALNSPGGLVAEGRTLADVIRSFGLVTVVPEGARCTSACVLLFAAGSRKIKSTGSYIGVHGATDASGVQSDAALAATVRMAKVYSAYGVPASVIARMVVTPPHALTPITDEEIMCFPWGAVQNFKLSEVPIALSGLDDEVRWSLPPLAPGCQTAGTALPTPAPPPGAFSAAPPHPAGLVRRATEYSTGYIYGDSIGDGADCNRAGGEWRRGCFAGSHEREKFDPPEGCYAHAIRRNPDPNYASLAREMCRTAAPIARHDKPTVASYVRVWLESYDRAYVTKSGEGACGNGVSPDNDGCSAGALAWPRTEAKR